MREERIETLEVAVMKLRSGDDHLQNFQNQFRPRFQLNVESNLLRSNESPNVFRVSSLNQPKQKPSNSPTVGPVPNNQPMGYDL